MQKYERSGKKLKVRIYWFQGVTKSFNLEKIGLFKLQKKIAL